MKIILSLRRQHYVTRVSILLITVALIAGMVGCGGGGGESYALAISSTEGGSVTTPGEGIFTYDKVTMVHLVAKTEQGHYFVNWTGDVGQITDVKAAVTTIFINDSYFITANFVKYIAMVGAGGYHTVGLKCDGTVVAVGWNYYLQCQVGGWVGITQVSACGHHTVGLKSDGTVVAVGWNDYGQCDVSGWDLS